MDIGVVGGGIVGVTTALLAARRGWTVTLFEAEPELWSRASAANEGKVHLGPVFAMGDDATLDVLRRGALSFAGLVEEAHGSPLPWGELTTEPFHYLVMPDSLLRADELQARYRLINDRLAAGGMAEYLGRPLPYLVDPTICRDERSGLPAFRTLERAVEPLRLGQLLVKAVAEDPLVTVQTGCRVQEVRSDDAGATLTWREGEESIETRRFDAVVNAAWDQQQSLLPEHHRVPHNFRLKCAVRLPRTGAQTPTVTLVQGPYGDVVSHSDYTYASWYPVARLSNEHDATPSPQTYARLGSLKDHEDLIEGQLAPLRRLGLLPDGSADASLVGGVIAGHGTLDIDVRTSDLHRRAEFGPHRHGRMVVATNFKLTTAPLAARLAVDDVASLLAA